MSNKPKSTMWRGEQSRYAHAKYDGNFVRVERLENSPNIIGARVTTSLPTDITGEIFRIKPELLYALEHVPSGTTLLGELYCEGMLASAVKSCLAGNISNASLSIAYFAVEQLACGVKDTDLWGRDLEKLELERLAVLFARWQLPFAPYIRSPDAGYTWDSRDLLERAHLAGLEGWVMKDGNLSNWRKLKRVRTIDCVVSGYEDGDGKYLGLLGSLRVGVFPTHPGANSKLVEIANVSGMTDSERIEMTETVIPQLESEDYAGTLVCEVAYQYVGSGGRLRHPRFVRWRDDKSPWECQTDQDEDLMERHG